MKWEEQGTARNVRYAVVPRTQSFLLHGEDVLLLRGASDKRLWAGKLNGVGGHIEPGEDVLAAARREIREETGLSVHDLELRAVVHISGSGTNPGVLLFVFVGRAPSREVRATQEGKLGWYPLSKLPSTEMVDDLPLLLPRLLARKGGTPLVYGNYTTGDSGQMVFRFVDE